MLLFSVCALFVVGRVVARELRTSERQSRYLAELSKQLTFEMGDGPSPSMRFPVEGPYDTRLGYTRLPTFFERLMSNNYMFATQARLSPRLQQLIDWGVFPIYHEKTQAGLRILDRHGAAVYDVRYPERMYASFEDIPALIVQTLLFIENRELLNPTYPYQNPAVEWDRFAKALLDMMVHFVWKDHPVAGGSTLATQIEKFRHSPHGQTTSAFEKLRQMVSASIRAYQEGVETLTTRRQILIDYLNTLPLAGLPGYGEVQGLGDGLWAWYNTDFRRMNQLLGEQGTLDETTALEARALAYKQVLSLLIALRSPSFYLQNPPALAAHTDTYLRLVHRAGLISPTLRDAALQAQLQVRQATPRPAEGSFLERKAINAVRTNLLTMLGVPGLYDLDRLDLTVSTTMDQESQAAVTSGLQKLREPGYVDVAGLRGPHLLAKNDDPTKIFYSLVLYERGAQTNLLRVHTDTVDQPFDVNRGMRLDLGSTAKLRVLITYLEVIAQLHNEYAGQPRQALLAVRVHPSDRLTRWAVDYLANTPAPGLLRMLEAAMDRRYSASPGESFFTGGGVHTFANFSREDDSKVLAVREAFRHSVNLVFIRMMRDIVYHYMFRVPGSTAMLLEDSHDAQRQAYLTRFADQEGRLFVHRFYRKYAGKSPEDILELLFQSGKQTPQSLATLYGAVLPNASPEAFAAFLQRRLPHLKLSAAELDGLYTRYVIAEFNLADRGYLTRIHPLELWVGAYLRHHPEASRQDITSASTEARQEVYQWLFKTRRKHTQDRRIRTLLEAEAFLEIHQAWQRLGYPFETIVPSYATAIGSSGDRPDALAELMGILVNDGIRHPIVSIQQLHFAAETPYETRMVTAPHSERVLPSEVATVAKQALLDVVEHGTARRLSGALRRSDGSIILIGGKTGTGDHRDKRFGRGGQLLTSRVVNRAATFVFMIDERFFGTVTAYVPGSEAAHYDFTSALPVQVLKSLASTLQPLLNGPADTGLEATGAGSAGLTRVAKEP
jgi:membrane peptidoglycan carboxypeptidase